MRYIRFILMMIFISCNTTAPVVESRPAPDNPYVIVWASKDERFIINYQVQKSKNNSKDNSKWVLLKTFTAKHLADTNFYNFQLPKTTVPNYYRIMALMKSGVITKAPFFISNTDGK